MTSKKKKTSKNNSRKRLSAKTDNQADYIRDMVESHITVCCGPAGSGKTAVCVGLACEYLLDQKISKIVVTRPVVESGNGLGYLPGGFDEKIQPYLVPIIEEINEFMRGRNFHESFMILDEAQNATFEQIKMFITRIGRRSKAVINGDLRQTDLPFRMQGGMEFCMDRLEDLHGVAVCELDESDIIRHDIISKVLSRLYDEQGEYQ